MLAELWGVDHDHSNAYTAWQNMGSPQKPPAAQFEHLKAAGQLQSLHSPRWIAAEGGSVEFTFDQPAQGVSLLNLSW
jgi:xylan 1,4-beta-xylosidase